MERLCHHLLFFILSAGATQMYGQTEKVSLVSAISEPEKNLERTIYLNLENESIRGLIVTTPGQEDQVISYETLAQTYVPIVAVAGIDAFLIHGEALGTGEYLISLRYLSKAPATLESFELKLARDGDKKWRLIDRLQGEEVRWIHLKARTFLGMTVGIESYRLSLSKPQI